MKKKITWALFILYLAIWGSYCGLELDSFVEDLPFFQINTLLFFINIVFVLLLPPIIYALCIQSRWCKNPLIRGALLCLNSFYVHLAVLLAVYKSSRNMDFDFNFFWYNISVAWSVLWKLFAPWLVAVFISMAAFVFLQRITFDPAVQLLKKMSLKRCLAMGLLIAGSGFCQYMTLDSLRGSAFGFLYASFFSDRHLRNAYHDLYKAHLNQLKSQGVQGAEKGDASLLGDMVIMVQQESLNGLLLKPAITPQLLAAARNGILFDHFYGNTIQSERGYECILCGVPPSIAGELVEDYPVAEVEKIGCLPRLFKTMGYKPIVFYGGNPNPRAIRLFEAIGFEKIIGSDITQPGDPMYDWGYREDIWFSRVDAYIQKHLRGKKLFIFITASATNHTPFKVLDPRYLDKVPYPDPRTFAEDLANTTFVQDAYFGHLYELYCKNYASNSTLIAISDHSWPIPVHKHNIYNERGAFEENFRIAMLMIPPSTRSEFAAGAAVSERFSQIDMLPTFLELAGVGQNRYLGESFAPWLLKNPGRERSAPRKVKVSIQPYGGGLIAVMRYPFKHLFDVLGKDVKVYNLEKDPQETAPVIQSMERHMGLIREFFRNARPGAGNSQ